MVAVRRTRGQKLHLRCSPTSLKRARPPEWLAMSAIGTKRTFRVALHMSAIEGKADIAPASQNVILRS